MKHILFLSLLSLTLWACKKETKPSDDPDIPYFDFKIYHPGSQESGSAQATVFGKEWNASATIARDPDSTSRYFEVFFETYSDDGSTRDQISFGLFEGRIGEYEVTSNFFDPNFDDFSIHCKYNFWISDGDLLYGNYFIDESFPNKVIIDKNDENSIEGRFWLLFTSNLVEHRDIPARVYFKEGKFQVKL
jgi:hypothetical protein